MKKLYLLNKKNRAFFISAFVALTFGVKAQVTTQTLSYIGAALQTFTVPAVCVSQITIEAIGAGGGSVTTNCTASGGLGASMKGVVTVTAGQVFTVMVGGAGVSNGSDAGGGGGSFVVKAGNIPVMVAGGGGGASNNIGSCGSNLNGVNASTTTAGTAGANGSGTGGTGGSGGAGVTGGGGGGGGFSSNGSNGGFGSAFVNGGAGGTGTSGSAGGYGGGGSGWDTGGNGGGGGGYSGGGCSGTSPYSGGGGGGSFNSGTSQVNTAGVRSGNGVVYISYIAGAAVTASASSNTICTSASVTLAAAGVPNYTWLPGGANTSSIVVAPTSNTNYSVIGQNTAGCQSTVVLSVVVQTAVPSLTVSNSASSGGICPLKTATLTASGATTYTWVGGTSVTNGVSFAPTTTSGYTVTGQNACGTSMAATSISIHPLPTIGAIASTPTLCSGINVTVTVTGNSISHTWSPNVTSGVGFGPSSTNTYVVTGSSALTCTASASVVVSVVVTPSLAPTTSPTLICIGKSATLTATGASVYSWSLGTTGIGTTNSIVVSPVVTTTYTIVKSNANCVDTKSIVVLVNNLPTPFAIVNPTIVCALQQVSLAVGGGLTYTWTAPGPPQYTFTGANPLVNPPGTGIFTVAAHDGTCIGTTTVLVTTNPNPTVTIALNTSSNICQGDTVNMVASGALTFTWTNPTSGGNNPAIVATPTTATNFQVVGTNTFGCISGASQIVLVNPTPTVFISANKPVVCAGFNSTLTATGGHTYHWSGNANGVNTHTAVVHLDSTMIFTVTGTYTNTGCHSNKSYTVLVHTPTFAVTSPTNTCDGGVLTLQASGANNGSYSWNIGDGQPHSFPSVVVTVTAASIYSVTASTTFSTVTCPRTLTTSVGIFYNPTVTAVPHRTLMCVKETVDIYGTGANTYFWPLGQEQTTTITVSPAANTNYTVIGTDIHGCMDTAVIKINVSKCNGIGENNQGQSLIEVYPNPSTGNFNIVSTETMDVVLSNELGQVIRTIHLSPANSMKHSVADLAPGIYFVSGQKDQMRFAQKIIITK